MTTQTSPTAITKAAADVEAALSRLRSAVARLGDGDLARAHRGGGWSVAQVISHLNVCTLLWVADVQRVALDPDLAFFFREEVGHDAVGYPPPTVDIATRQLDSTRRTLATTLAAFPASVLGRSVEIPDLGTMSIGEWTPLIIGHLVGHVDQAFEIMHDRGFAPEGI
jgi:DinB superfamily